MKKYIALSFVFIFVLGLVGCGEADAKPSGPLVLTAVGGEEMEAYENFVWGTDWEGDGWISTDGMRMADKFSRVKDEIPCLPYAENWEMQYRKDVTSTTLSVYDSSFVCLHSNSELADLRTLAAGEYYLVIDVTVQGRYIKSEKDYEASGYECVYKVVIPE